MTASTACCWYGRRIMREKKRAPKSVALRFSGLKVPDVMGRRVFVRPCEWATGFYPGEVVPSITHCVPSQATPSLASTRPAAPGTSAADGVEPSRTVTTLTPCVPRLAVPRRAAPCQASHSRAPPGREKLSRPESNRAETIATLPHCGPCRAAPRLALPCLALPRLDHSSPRGVDDLFGDCAEAPRRNIRRRSPINPASFTNASVCSFTPSSASFAVSVLTRTRL